MSPNTSDYICLTTFKKSGEAITTTARIVANEGGKLCLWTSDASGKFKRLSRDRRVFVQPADQHGHPILDSCPMAGLASLVQTGELFERVRATARQSLGVAARVGNLVQPKPRRLLRRKSRPGAAAETVVVIDLEDERPSHTAAEEGDHRAA